MIGHRREVGRKKEIMYLLRPYHVTAGIVLVELVFIFTKINGFIYRRHHATNLCTNRNERANNKTDFQEETFHHNGKDFQ